MKDDIILEVKELVRRRDLKFSLKGISFQLKANEIVGILGPNGAGKTTAFEVLAGLADAESGDIIYNWNVSGKNGKRNIGYAPEVDSVWNELSVEEQCHYILDLYGLRDKSGIEESLKDFQLWKYRKKRAGRLSQGNRKKLSLLLSMLHDPQVLILDEPFNGLDLTGRSRLRSRLKRFAAEAGHGVLLSSHQLEEVQKTAGRVLILQEGELKASFDLESNGAGQFDLPRYYHSVIGEEDD